MSLTAPERMVLELVREGRFDAEIAVRLGLSNEEVKRRIAVICTKVGVADRAALRGAVTAGFAARDERDDWSPVIDSTVDPLPREAHAEDAHQPIEQRDRRPIAAIAGMLLALGVAAFAAWLALGLGDADEEPREPSVLSITDDPGTIISSFIQDPSSTQMAIYADPMQTGGFRSAVLAGKGTRSYATDFDLFADTLTGTSGTPVPGAKDLDVSAPLPGGIELLLVRGSSKGGPIAVERAFRDNSGQVVVDSLFEAPAGARILQVVATPNGGSLAASVCYNCTPLLGAESPHARVDFYRSEDAGVTWEIAGSRSSSPPFGIVLLAITAEGLVIRQEQGPPEILGKPWPACRVEHDNWSKDPAYRSTNFYAVLERGVLGIQKAGTAGLYDCNGSHIFTAVIGSPVLFDAYRYGPASDDRSALSWHTTEDVPKHFLGVFSLDGVDVLQVPNTTRIAGWLSARMAIGDVRLSDADRSISPALIDFDGTITLLEAPLRAMPITQAAGLPEDERPPQVLEVLAVRHGTNATVVLPDGVECAPVAHFGSCLAAGVRVRTTVDSNTTDPEWADITLPGYDADCREDCVPARALIRREFLE